MERMDYELIYLFFMVLVATTMITANYGVLDVFRGDYHGYYKIGLGIFSLGIFTGIFLVFIILGKIRMRQRREIEFLHSLKIPYPAYYESCEKWLED
jgi:hypothetical protein